MKNFPRERDKQLVVNFKARYPRYNKFYLPSSMFKYLNVGHPTQNEPFDLLRYEIC